LLDSLLQEIVGLKQREEGERRGGGQEERGGLQ